MHNEAMKRPTIVSQVLTAENKVRQDNKVCICVYLSSLKFLLRQGLAIRGHSETNGNLIELLRTRSIDIPQLTTWLNKTTNFLSHEIQNEIIDMFSHSILNNILESVRAAGQFSIIVDGTKDISGDEQESICLRYVSPDLEPKEVFVGFYTIENTTGSHLAKVVYDILLRLNIDVRNLRGQTYDGAANMAGAYNGCQAIISN